MARTVVVDTGYWLALFDPSDQYHSQAKAKAHHVESLEVLAPWPTLYETLGTRFVKNRIGLALFERVLKRQNVMRIDDSAYRVKACERTLDVARGNSRSISLCDFVIWMILEDANVRTNFLLTFNPRDFVDVCRKAKVTIL